MSSRKTSPLSPKTAALSSDEKTARNLDVGSLIFTRGRGLLSRLILAAQGDDGEMPSHTAILISADPPLVAEPVHPRVKVRPFEVAIKDAERVVLYSSVDKEAGRRIATNASFYISIPYDYAGVYFLAIRLFFRARQPLWWRILFLATIPVVLPLVLGGSLRDILENLLGSLTFALLEGLILFLLGALIAQPFLRSVPKLPSLMLAFLWIGWVAFIELRAWSR